ncbi:hypothetical protein Taro_004208 [Colocasia esculenta]|uniref:1-phosphatidylinositol 4-kinase n=1 Tax=Colocasia esculenta TaxID=4460 RepID=A0A843TNV6_COLES|nr:hypothetical protein [Colocasia esculenta]
MAVSVLKHTFSGECHGNKTDGKPVGRRRVFVQTDTGCVLGMELDRGDNAHTIKRRLQLALNVPTEESCLTFGDLVLNNDLSAIRNDSPLLLTRNILHRSSSTPCLSPSGKDIQQRDQSGPIEILGHSTHCPQMKQLVKDVVKGIKAGVDPIPVHGGLGGAYYFRNVLGDNVAIVKPTDEEPFAPNNPKGFIGKTLGQPGLKWSVRVGETGFREVAACILDYNNFANVPPTVLVKVTHSIFNVNEVNGSSSKARDKRKKLSSKIASFQQFIPHDFDASDHGTSSFPVASVHRIGILDIRILNTDRHAGNLLVRKLCNGVGQFGCQVELIPIDHGLCLPESLEDPYFEWIHWPQASIPFSEEELNYIANLDPAKDCDTLKTNLPMIREACLRVLVVCTIFLKEAAAFGLCLAEIGEMMSREFKGMVEEPSELENVCMEARRLIAEREQFPLSVEAMEEEHFQFEIDCEGDEDFMPSKASPTFHFGCRGGSSRNPLSRLEESVEEEQDEAEEFLDGKETDNFSKICGGEQLLTIGKLSMSLMSVGLADKRQHYQVGGVKGHSTKSNCSNSGDLQGNSRSTYEQLPAGASFVKLTDMGETEWEAFLEEFQELLLGAFWSRKSATIGRRQRQRMGTSCQF